MTENLSWQQRIGNQRDWVWRGWQVRYSFIRSNHSIGKVSLPPLIFIHGFGASIEHWRNNLSVISQYYTVYALDLLGFGASRKASVDYSADLWREQIRDFWQTFIARPTVLVGNSIGSLVCLSVADTYPDMVAGLVMLSLPDVSVRQEMLPRLLRPVVTKLEDLVASPLLIENLLKFLRKPGIIRRWARIAYHDKTAVTDELVEILANPAYDRGSEKTLYSLSKSVRKAGFAAPVKETIPRLNLPMLLIWGLRDRMVPPQQAREIAALNSQIELVELEDVGHCPHDECPDRFNSLLLSWLQKL
ncbi:alpha/beta fold hydrolase [Myxosarcina sp. GI1]|uniref:alpha/beta fold hydrolase n=1 Tax=Myxosarcina sp. GI1 TaxID=1541065 RepID=UPI000562FE47|nr:alpha/beta fold hydrolase [Myxosarcina sp. GI1]